MCGDVSGSDGDSSIFWGLGEFVSGCGRWIGVKDDDTNCSGTFEGELWDGREWLCEAASHCNVSGEWGGLTGCDDGEDGGGKEVGELKDCWSVSYTHLTLPTKA